MSKIHDFNGMEAMEWPSENGPLFRFPLMSREELLEGIYGAVLGINDSLPGMPDEDVAFSMAVRNLLANAFRHLVAVDVFLGEHTEH